MFTTCLTYVGFRSSKMSFKRSNMHLGCEDQMSRHLQRCDAMATFFEDRTPAPKRRRVSRAKCVVDSESLGVLGAQVSRTYVDICAICVDICCITAVPQAASVSAGLGPQRVRNQRGGSEEAPIDAKQPRGASRRLPHCRTAAAAPE